MCLGSIKLQWQLRNARLSALVRLRGAYARARDRVYFIYVYVCVCYNVSCTQIESPFLFCFVFFSFSRQPVVSRAGCSAVPSVPSPSRTTRANDSFLRQERERTARTHSCRFLSFFFSFFFCVCVSKRGKEAEGPTGSSPARETVPTYYFVYETFGENLYCRQKETVARRCRSNCSLRTMNG